MTKDQIAKELCVRIIEEGKKILALGYNVRIVCEDIEVREKEEKKE